jgi:hypothetical protein
MYAEGRGKTDGHSDDGLVGEGAWAAKLVAATAAAQTAAARDEAGGRVAAGTAGAGTARAISKGVCRKAAWAGEGCGRGARRMLYGVGSSPNLKPKVKSSGTMNLAHSCASVAVAAGMAFEAMEVPTAAGAFMAEALESGSGPK